MRANVQIFQCFQVTGLSFTNKLMRYRKETDTLSTNRWWSAEDEKIEQLFHDI